MTRRLSPDLTDAVVAHLQHEQLLMQATAQIAEKVTRDGWRGGALAAQRAELAKLARIAEAVSDQRRRVRDAIADAWECTPEEVHMSQLAVGSAERAAIEPLRRSVEAAAAHASARIQTSTQSLAAWSQIVESVLQQVLLEGGGPSDRYTATGRRAMGPPLAAVDLRS